jgi:hypothetical protein
MLELLNIEFALNPSFENAFRLVSWLWDSEFEMARCCKTQIAAYNRAMSKVRRLGTI